MDTGAPMAEVARALILARQARRGPVTSARIRRSRWPSATPRPDSSPGAFARSPADRLATAMRIAVPPDNSGLAKRSPGAWRPAADRP